MSPAPSLSGLLYLRRCGVALFFLILSANPARASYKEDVKSGNALYNKGRYKEAANRYEIAVSDNPKPAMANFNLGDALYKDKAYEKAINSYNKAIASGEAGVVQKSDYNIACSRYRLGDKESALQFYKRAIDLDPADKDAKFNYEFLQIKIFQMKDEDKKQDKKDEKKDQDKNKDQQKDKQKEDQKEQQKNQDNQKSDKDKESQESQGGGQGQEDQNKQDKDKEQQQQQEQQKQQQQQDQQKEQSKQDQQPQQNKEEGKGDKDKSKGGGKEEERGLEAYNAPQAEGEPQEMTAAEAKMLLEGYKGEEATGKVVRMRKEPIRMSEPAKDW